jgi:hypothetical protein
MYLPQILESDSLESRLEFGVGALVPSLSSFISFFFVRATKKKRNEPKKKENVKDWHHFERAM